MMRLPATAADVMPVEIVSAADAPQISPVELLMLFGGGLLLILVVRAVKWAEPLLPMPNERRERWQRIGVIAELVLWLFYLASAIAWSLQGSPAVRLAALACLALVVVLATWFVIRDYLTGVVLRSERHVHVGDMVRFGEVEGHVRRFGKRTIELEMADGDRVFVPYRQLRDVPIIRRHSELGAVRHTFRVTLPAGVGAAQARDAIRCGTLLSHWISPGHDPSIQALDHDTLVVTVHALNDVRAADIEAAVYRAVEALAEP